MKSARWWLALGFLAFGVAAVGDWKSSPWIGLTLVLYAIPLFSQFVPSRLLRVYGLWFGFFLLLQTFVTPLAGPRYITLRPNLRRPIEVLGDAMPGISGVQTITTDKKGFRVTKDVDYETKPPGTLRIFAIGASTTAQIMLDDHRTWPLASGATSPDSYVRARRSHQHSGSGNPSRASPCDFESRAKVGS